MGFDRLRLVLKGVAFAALIGSAGGVLAQDPAVDLLKRVLQANETLRFSGRRIVEVKLGPRVERHTEQIFKDGPRTRVEFPDTSINAGQIIVETPNQRLHYHPDRNEVHVLPPRRSEALQRLEGLLNRASRLQFRMESGESVANRRTSLVSISDRDGNRIQDLWIDVERDMILRRAMYDAVGTRVGFFEFQVVDFAPRFPPGVFTIRRANARWLRLNEIADNLAREKGFAPVVLRHRDAEIEYARVALIQGRDALMLGYRVGDDRVTLFQLPTGTDVSRIRRPREQTHLHTWTQDGRTFALVGNVDRRRLEELARRVVIRQE